MAWSSPQSRSIGSSNPTSGVSSSIDDVRAILAEKMINNPITVQTNNYKPPTQEEKEALMTARPKWAWILGPRGGFIESLYVAGLYAWAEHPIIWTGVLFVAGVAITVVVTNRLGITKVSVQ
jgi:hypothetical protein